MKINSNKEISAFIRRVKHNLNDDVQNEFLDAYIDEKEEKYLRKELIKAGQSELKDKTVSLFLSVDEFLKNPYYQNIKLDKIATKHFKYVKEPVAGAYLFNSDVIIDDEDRELKDYMKLRALDKDYEAIFLYQDDEAWMMNVPSESITNDPYALKAKGHVVTFGLGIGYFAYMALINENVKSVTVIEKSKEVIDLFKKEIYPQFPKDKELKIIQEDAFNCFNKKFLGKYDYIYVDIWKSSIDGLNLIEKLLEQYNPPIDSCDFWIFDSCIEILRTLIFLHFDELINHKTNKVDKTYTRLMNKVRTYFKKIDITVDDVDTLKDYLYSRQTARDILAINL